MVKFTRFRLGVLVGLTLLVAFPLASSLASPTGIDIDPEFQDYYEQSGGLPVFGYAVSEPAQEDGRLVQYFERQRLELHPEHAGTPYVVLLGHLGWQDAERRGLLDHEAFQALSGGNNEGEFFSETGHNLSGIFRDYWHANGLDFGDRGVSFRESLALFGYPISEEFVDPDSGLVTQYFERARFEHHPEHQGTEYEVLLGHLGNSEVDFLRANGRGPGGDGAPGQNRGNGNNGNNGNQDSEPEPEPTPDPVDDGAPSNAVNVKDTGARGDGRTDDTDAIKSAIQRAQNQGRSTVYLPEGTYMIRAGAFWNPVAEEIILPAGMSLIGAGQDNTKIKVIPSSIDSRPNQMAIVLMSNTRVANLSLDGSKGEVSRSGKNFLAFHGLRVQPWDTRNVTIENVRIHDIIGINAESFGTMLNGVTGATLKNIEAFNVDGSGIHIDGDIYQTRATNVRLTNATVYNNYWAGVSVYGASGVVVEGVTAYNNRLGGLNVEWSENIRFQDSHSHNNGFAGLVTNGKNDDIQLVRLSMGGNEWSEVRLQENRYHVPNPSTGKVEEGVTRSMSVRDTDLSPRSGRPEFIIRTSSGNDDPDAIFNFSGNGSDSWTVWNETS